MRGRKVASFKKNNVCVQDDLQGPMRLPFMMLLIVMVCPPVFTVVSTTPFMVVPA